MLAALRELPGEPPLAPKTVPTGEWARLHSRRGGIGFRTLWTRKSIFSAMLRRPSLRRRVRRIVLGDRARDDRKVTEDLARLRARANWVYLRAVDRRRRASYRARLTVAGCATVHQEDLDAWAGHPVSDLDKHPILLTFPVVRATAADGTEIRDYRNVAQCSGGGSVFAGQVSMATYSGFTNCMQQFAACHGIFYIKNGVIDHVSAIGTGGLRCYTDASMRPGFSGSANVR